jgi:hypothetical protein
MPTNNNINYGPAPLPGTVTVPVIGNNIDRAPAPVPAPPASASTPPVFELPVSLPPPSSKDVVPVTAAPVDITGSNVTAGPNLSATNQQRYITILDNGTVVTNNATTLNFLGTGVTVGALGTTGANITITGGSNVSPGGSSRQIQYNNNGTFTGSSGLTWDNANAILSVAGNILSTASGQFYGNINTGTNAFTAGIQGYTALGSNVVAQFSSNVNSYAQINFQNISNSNRASSDYILTADNGTDSTYYLDLGIAGSNHTDPAFFGDTSTRNDGYLYVVASNQAGPSNNAGNLILGSSDGVIKMYVGNTAQANVKATVSSSGLSVTGNISGNNVSTGIITLTNGAVIKDTAGNAIAIGRGAGDYPAQGINAVAVGNTAGNYLQGNSAVAVGDRSGGYTQGNSAVAVGLFAGNYLQSANAVAVGNSAGYTGQGTAAVAIGTNAGVTNQGNNSIIINATAANLNQTTANTFTVAPVRNDVANIANVMFYNATSKEITYGNTISVAGNVVGGNILTAGVVSATSNITGAYIFGNGSQLTGLPATYGNSNVSTYLAAYGSNTISTTGNITAGNLIGNISITGNIAGTSSNVQLVAGTYTWTFDNTGNLTVPAGGDILLANTQSIISAAGNITAGQFIGNGSTLTSVATQSSGSWTLATGTNTVNFTVTGGYTYSMWVTGNIPNGIVIWNATGTVTNTNVPVIGQQFGWYYAAGNALVLTSMPSQIIGTAGSISNAAPAVANANVFNFTIVNNSGNSQTVYYGWTKIS